MKIQDRSKKIVCSIKKWIPLTIIVLFTTILCIIYVDYIDVAKCEVPIMDYWRHIAQYGQKILDGELRLTDLFSNSFAGHLSPLSTYITFTQLGKNGFDMVQLIEIGLALRILLACFLLALFLKKYYRQYVDKPVWLIILSTALIMTVLNYNQWEIATQQFSQGFMLRIVLYVLFFLAGDWFLFVIENKPRSWHFGYAIIYGLLIAADGMLMSSGYIVGFMGAIGLTYICVFLRRYKEWKHYLYPFAALAVPMIAGMLGYIYMLQSGDSSSLPGKLPDLLSVFQGIVLYYGGIFIPNTYVESNGTLLAYLVGIFVLCITVVEVIIYVKNDRQGKKILPLMCIFYAFIISITVTLTRIEVFGLTTTMSSRYVVESTLGIIGLIWIIAENRVENGSKLGQGRQMLLVSAIIVMLAFNMATELRIAPYRGLYSKNLEKFMLTIDLRADEELAVMQSPAAYVRQAVAFLRENRLSIFADPEKWTDEKHVGVDVLRGLYDDGWVGSSLDFGVYTEEPSVLIFDGYIYGTLTGTEQMEIYVNDEFVGVYVIERNAFTVEILLDECGESIVSIKNNFAIKATSPDVRENLAFILSNCRLSVIEMVEEDATEEYEEAA